MALTWTLDLPTNIFVKDNPGKSGAAARSVLARCRVIFLPGPHKANRSPPQSHPQTHGKIQQSLNFKSPKLTVAVLTSSQIRLMSPTPSGPEQDLFFPTALIRPKLQVSHCPRFFYGFLLGFHLSLEESNF